MRSLSLRDPGFVGNLGGKDEFPIGGIIMWSSSTIPDGWAVCNGSNGTPDLRDRFVAGAGNSYAVGATGGSNSVTLTTAQLPSHAHSRSLSVNSSGSHGHSAYTAVARGPYSETFMDGFAWGPSGTSTSSNSFTHSHTLTGDTGSSGSGGAHENRPPYRGLNYIMRLS
jgi:microcystin-dependent protein